MNKKHFFLISILLLSLFVIPLTSSWGPSTHFNITLTAISQSEDTLIKQIMLDNWDGCLAGIEYADVGIFKYYTNFREYAELHDYNSVDELLRNAKDDKQRAFAYCWKIHLAQDGVSHNIYIPASIKSTKLPNDIIHVIQELKLEGKYLNPVANRLMEKHAEYDDFVTQSLGKDWSAEANKLNAIMGGGEFYSKAYAPESTTWFGKFQNVIYKVVGVFTSEQKTIDYYKLSVDETKAVLRGETSQFDPSGEIALRSADSQSQIWLYVGTFIIFIILLIILKWRRWI